MSPKVTVFVILFLSLLNFSISQTAPVLEYGYLSYSGSITGDQISYQNKLEFQSIQNVLNPVLVYINYDSGDQDANVCINSNQLSFPVSGATLQNSCPNGAFGIISNTTTIPQTSQLYKRSRLSPKQNSVLSKLVEDTTDSVNAELYLKPTSGTTAGFIVTIPGLDSNTTVNFNIEVTATYCEDPDLYPVGTNNDCVEIPTLNTTDSQSLSIPSNTWVYYKYVTGAFDSTVLNSFTFTQSNKKKIDMYVQSGYYPTDTWYLDTDLEEDDDGNELQTIYSPGRTDSGEVYFVGLYNTDSATQSVVLSVSVSVCSSAGNISANCDVQVGLNDTLHGFGFLSANISDPFSSQSFDYSDADAYDGDFAQFVLTSLPLDIGDSYYVRVSVGNNNIGKYDFPPAIFAKLNGYPSLESFDYNTSNVASAVANQLSLPVNDPLNDVWYIMVQLPASFTIWVGNNCQGDCVGYDGQGSCSCSFNFTTVPCTNFANNTYNYFQIPTTTGDSAGVCSCSDNKYSKSFNCSQKVDYHTIYLVLLLLIGIAIIIVAIAVPAYRFVKRQKSNYDSV